MKGKNKLSLFYLRKLRLKEVTLLSSHQTYGVGQHLKPDGLSGNFVHSTASPLQDHCKGEGTL